MNRLSTRTRFILASLVLVLPLVFVSGILLDESFKRSQKQVIVNEFATADVVAQSVSELVTGQQESLKVLAEEEAIRAIDQRPDEALTLMDDYRLSRNAVISGMFLYTNDFNTNDFNLILSTSGIDLSTLDPGFETTVDAALTGGQPAVSDSLMLTSGGVEVIAIIVPVYANPDPAANSPEGTPTAEDAPDQPPSGALGAFYSVDRLITGFLPTAGFSTGSDIAIGLVTSTGKLVTPPGGNSDPEQIFLNGESLDSAIMTALGGQRSQATFTDPAGLRRVMVAVPIPLSGNRWAVVVSGPETTAFEPNATLIDRAFLAIGGAVVLSVLLAILIGEWLTMPFRQLFRQASALSTGGATASIDTTGPSDAVHLSSTIRDMADRLRAQVRDTESAREEIARQAERLRDLLRRTVRLQEDERRRIASDIHDAVSPLITGALYQTQAVRLAQANGNGNGHLQLSFASAENSAEDQPELNGDQDGLRAVSELLEEAMRELHDVIFDLRPPDLDDIGIVAALQRHVDQVNRSGFPSRLEVAGDERRLSPEVRLAVYRIVQEALHNALRHARADESVVHIEWSSDRMRVTVQDDGSGFDLERPGRRGGLGLMSMRERAASIGASFEIVSRPGSGTAVIVERESNELDLASEPTNSHGEVDVADEASDDSDNLANLDGDEEETTQ